MTFVRFVAVDWSGARGPNYSGIAVAQCSAGDGPPRLVAPPDGRRWRRSEVLAWMLAAMADGGPVLFGFDFAFCLPFADRGAYLPGLAAAPGTPAALWRRVDEMCAAEADFYAGILTAMPELAGQFWTKGRQPGGFVERLRATDRACRASGRGRPQSAFKLIGAAQVGKGALAGMRFLHALKGAAGNDIAIWPFDGKDAGRHVCCEIYPGLFTAAAKRRGKVRNGDDLAAILAWYGCGARAVAPSAADDHEADALVSAAGLRYYAGREETWKLAAGDRETAAREGWILGVPPLHQR